MQYVQEIIARTGLPLPGVGHYVLSIDAMASRTGCTLLHGTACATRVTVIIVDHVQAIACEEAPAWVWMPLARDCGFEVDGVLHFNWLLILLVEPGSFS